MTRKWDRLDDMVRRGAMEQLAAQTTDRAPPPPATSDSAALRPAGTSLALRPPPPVLARPGISPTNASPHPHSGEKSEPKAAVTVYDDVNYGRPAWEVKAAACVQPPDIFEQKATVPLAASNLSDCEYLGRCARLDNLSSLDNPYRAMTLEANAWQNGWSDADYEEGRPKLIPMPRVYSDKPHHRFGCRELDRVVEGCGCQAPIERVVVTPIPPPIGFSGKPADEEVPGAMVAMIRGGWPGSRTMQRVADRIEALERSNAYLERLVASLRRELDMQSAAEPASLPPGYVVLMDTAYPGSMSIKSVSCGINGPEWTKPVLRDGEGWNERGEFFLAGNKVRGVTLSRQVDPPSCTCPGPCIAPHHEADMAQMSEATVNLVAGHKFEGIGGCRCCVLPKQGGDGVELCGRYWDEIKDADGSWLNRADVAHVGGLNQSEIDGIRLEVKREADLRETMERATSDLAGRSLRG